MRLLTRTFILMLVAGLFVTALPARAVNRARRLVRPPANCEVVKPQGQLYACGAVYLTAHRDTSLLRPFGFRKFEFLGWTLGRCRYNAIWPVNVPLDSLPTQISDLEYNRVNDGPTEEQLMAEYDPFFEEVRTSVLEQDARDLLEPGRSTSTNFVSRRSRGGPITYGRQSDNCYRMSCQSSYQWVRSNWRDDADYEPESSGSIGYEYATRYGTNGYYSRRSRWPYYSSNWDSDSYESGASISRCGSGRYNEGYQPVPCGSRTTLETTPIQNSYSDWRNSGSPFMSGNGGIGFNPSRVYGR